MKKKVKKIPKYNGGTPNVDDLSWILKNLGLQKGVAGAGQIAGAIGGVSQGIASTLGIEQGKTGQIISGIGQIASNFGPVGQIVGGALQTVGAFTGAGGSVDQNTGEYTKSSGLTRILGFGRSDDSVMREANRVKGSILAKASTEDLKANWMNQGINPAPNVLAAEGGIMRQPVDALVSKGELIYNPVTKKLSQVPGSKGKPNKADDVYAKLYEGDVVISNSPTMLMANGKTPALNLMGMVDKYSTGGTVKAREAIIKKVVNWQEANKTKPLQYAMYSEGKNGVKMPDAELIDLLSDQDLILYTEAFNRGDESTMRFLLKKYGNRMSNVVMDELVVKGTNKKPISKVSNSVKASDPAIKKFTKIDADGNSYSADRDKMASWRRTPTQHEIDVFRFGKDYKQVQEARNNKNESAVYVDPNNQLETLVVTAPKKSNKKSQKSENTNATKQVVKETTPTKVAENLKNVQNDDFGERHFLRQPVEKTTLTQIALNNTVKKPFLVPPITVLKPGQQTENTPENGFNGDGVETKTTGSDWKDSLYRMAVLSQPWWDMAKAEPVNYTLPNAKYVSVGADPTPLMKSADETYSIGNYNFAQFGGSTGQRMGYGAALANNRAKQYADAYKWQQDVQNKQIAQNVGIYNNWDTQRTEILNDVFDKTAANTATARNINRKNATSALNNWGAMLNNNDKKAIEKMKFKILEPAIRSTYEDATANDLINIYNSLFG